MTGPMTIARGSGVAAWKQIADRISLAILAGDYDGTRHGAIGGATG